MKLERTKNAKRNIFFGLINKIIALFLPFLIRTIIIHFLSVEYLGLSSLFSSILEVLNITELGFSSAVVFCMYKAIAENDNDTICAILNFFKKVYRVIGAVILGLGLIILPFITYLINGAYPADINIYVLYLLYLANSVLSYFLFSYRSSLLNAYQREDILSNINSIVKLLSSILQIVVLIVFKNFYLFVVANIIGTVLTNILAYIFTNIRFPNLKPKGQITEEHKEIIKDKLKGLLINKITGKTRNTFDSIFISLFLGLAETAIYNNYYLIMNGVIGFFAILMTSISAGLGNSVATESVEKNFDDLNRINFIYMWISGLCAVFLLCLYQPFTALFFGEEMLFPMLIPVLFTLYFYLLKMSDVLANYRQATGLWWESRYACIFEAIANIILNFILGKYFGVRGILLATLISVFLFDFLLGTYLVFKYYFKIIRLKKYFITHLFYFIVTLVGGLISFYICNLFSNHNFINLLLKFVICFIVVNSVYFVCYSPTKIFKISKKWFLNKIKL